MIEITSAAAVNQTTYWPEPRVQAAARQLIDRFRGEFLNDEGLISRDYPPSARTIFDNFDDLAPFMAWLGAEDLLLDQVRKLLNDA